MDWFRIKSGCWWRRATEDNAKELKGGECTGSPIPRSSGQSNDKAPPGEAGLDDTSPPEEFSLDNSNVKDELEAIRSHCGVSSISFGILHDGKLSCGNVGSIDPYEHISPDSKTLYTLSSISKTFVVACVGILVDEGKLSWVDPVRKHLPEFIPTGDKRIATEATLNDFFRHSSGLGNPVVTWLGPKGTVLLCEEKFMELLNSTPTVEFRSGWMYSNIGIALMALVVERAGGERYADFLHKRILEPLAMADTVVYKADLTRRDNIAAPYVEVKKGKWIKIEHEWTSEENTPVLSMIGVRSSVKDLLKWAAAMMHARHNNKTASMDTTGHSFPDPSEPETSLCNPLRQIPAILDGWYWTRPHDDPHQNASQFHLSWMRVEMPSIMVHWGSYNSRLADNGGPEDENYANEHIIGNDSPKKTMFKNVGLAYCTAATINLFPDTNSAIVVLSNGLNRGDAADFTASLLMQEMFNLQPRIDILGMVHDECLRRVEIFHKRYLEWKEHKDTSKPEAPIAQFQGKFCGMGLTLTVRQRQGSGRLELCFNEKEDIVEPLEYYNEDKYSYFQTSREKWLAEAWLDWDYYMVAVLDFKRDDQGTVIGFHWKYDEFEEPALFKKTEGIT